MNKYILNITILFIITIQAYSQIPDNIFQNYVEDFPTNPSSFNSGYIGGQLKPESIERYTSLSEAYFPVLLVDVEFLNETTDPNSTIWTAGQNPSYFGTMIATQKASGYGNNWWDAYDEQNATMSDYWMEVSRGTLHVCGQEVHVVLPHEASWYNSNGGFSQAMEDLYNALATTTYNIDWTKYDKWSGTDVNLSYSFDNYVDMIYINFRTHQDVSGMPAAGQSPMPQCTHSNGHIVYDNGVRQIKILPSFSSEGSGFLINPYSGGPFPKLAVMGLTQHEHGHFLFSYRDFGFLAAHQEYGKINNYHGWDYFYSPYEVLRMGWFNSRKATYSSSTTSYTIGDFSSRNTNQNSELLEVPIGDESRNEFYLIANREKVSYHDKIMFGDTAHDDAFRIGINPDYGKGVYIYHAYPGRYGSGYQWQVPFDHECADGLYNWTQNGYQHPDWRCDQDVEYYIKTSVDYDHNDNGGINNDLNYHDGKSIYNWFGIGKKEYPVCSGNDGTDRIYTNNNEVWTSREWLGDRWDPWNVGYNQVFSPYSSPSTRNWDDIQSGIFIYLESQDNTTPSATLKIYKIGSPYSEEEILHFTPPSKPMGLSISGYTDCENNFSHPIITWNHNMEPDMIRWVGGDHLAKRYNVYRAISNGTTDIPVNYSLISQVDVPVELTPVFIDYNNWIKCSDEGFIKYVRYEVTAVDTSEWESVKSDFISMGTYKMTVHNNVIVPKNIPSAFELNQNYPNPFNPVTLIKYALPNDANVVIKIYNLLGEEVKTLVNEFKTAGFYSVTFDGTNLASGIYFYRIEAGNFVSVKKMALVR